MTYTEHDNRLPFILHTLGEVARQGPICRPLGVAWNQFIWLKNGSGTFRSGEESFTLRAGEGIFLRNSVPHSYEGEEMHTCWCTFYAAENLLDYVMGDRAYLLFRVPNFLDRETAALQQYVKEQSDLLACSAAGYSYVTELFGAITKNADPIISRVREFMKQHYAEPLTLDGIAAQTGQDRYALCHYFQKNHPRSVMEELDHIRISFAKRMLRFSSDPIERIAASCGFESPSYFSYRFKKACGCTPRSYRGQMYR